MSDEPVWVSDVLMFLVHPTEAAVWQPEGGSPALRFSTEKTLWHPMARAVNDAARERWGIDAITLRCVFNSIDRAEMRKWMAFLLCPRSLDTLPSGEWRPIAELSEDAHPVSPMRDDALAALRSLDHPAPPERKPWTSRGWFDEAVAWAESALDDAGIERLSPAQQFGQWGLCCVIRFETSAGAFYFKAAARPGLDGASDFLLFANEAALTSLLATSLPGHIPEPIAVDRDRGWTLLPDAGVTIDEELSIDAVENALRLHARHQCAWTGRATELLAAGCVDRRLPSLRAEIDGALDDEGLLQFLDPEERDRLRASRPILRAAVDELESLGIPDSLVHGDLHTGNVARRGDTVVFFDWTDGAVGCPFFDFLSLAEDRDVREAFPDARTRLFAAYVDEWEGVAPRATLERALTLCRTLALLYQAASFRHVAAEVEEPDRSAALRGGASFLRELSARLRRGEAF